MLACSSLVNVAEDAELRLVALLGEYSKSLSVPDCEACIAAGDAAKLLSTITSDKAAMEAFLTMPSVDEAVGSFSLLVALLERADVSKSKQLSVTKLADSILQAKANSSGSEDATTQCQRKIRLLSVIYNLRSNVAEKCEILTRMVATAGATPQHAAVFLAREETLGSLLVDENNDNTNSAATTTFVHPSVPRIVHMLDAWKISQPNRRALYKTIASVMPEQDSRKQRFQLLLVETYNTASSSDKNDKERLEAAKQAAIGAIRDPIALFAHQRNLLHQPAIQALQSADKVLFDLLKVFQEGKLQDYQDFIKSNGGNEEAILSKWGLDASKCQDNIRVLSLCSLATEHEEIPYSIIASTLQLENGNNAAVERQVISAVSSGLLQAKMDQLAQKVMVERAVFRRFDVEQWKVLQGRLQTWKSNVGSILTSLKQQQASTAPAAAPAAAP